MEWKILTSDSGGEAGIVTGKGPLDQLMKIVILINHKNVKVFKIENGVEIQIKIPLGNS